MELCLLTMFWLFNVLILVIGYLFDKHPSLLPIMPSLFRWGKMRIGHVDGGETFYLLPKRWYQHFYVTGVFVNGILLILVCLNIFFGQPFPAIVRQLLEIFQHPTKETGLTDAIPLLTVLSMHQIQVMRRCYETYFVNIFSKNASMSFFIYGFGILFYALFGLSVLTGVDFQHLEIRRPISHIDIGVYATVFAVFIIASFLQNQSFRILAALRINKKDSTEKAGYIMPCGGLFDYVSCPHFLAEMIIYICFAAVFCFQHTVLLSVLLFVITNQLMASVMTHAWYRKTFPNYPTQKKSCDPIHFVIIFKARLAVSFCIFLCLVCICQY